MSKKKIKIFLVDDHIVMLEGICALLSLTPDIEVVGKANNGREALQMIDKHLPDIILMDFNMPLMDALSVITHIYKKLPKVKILVFSQHNDKEHVIPLLIAGVSGFFYKTTTSSELTHGIRSVYSGDSFLSPSITRLLVEDYQHKDNNGKGGWGDSYGQLTGREKEIFKLLSEGYTPQEIACLLSISPKTVDSHKTNIMSKLNLHNRVELVKYALRRGVITV